MEPSLNQHPLPTYNNNEANNNKSNRQQVDQRPPLEHDRQLPFGTTSIDFGAPQQYNNGVDKQQGQHSSSISQNDISSNGSWNEIGCVECREEENNMNENARNINKAKHVPEFSNRLSPTESRTPSLTDSQQQLFQSLRPQQLPSNSSENCCSSPCLQRKPKTLTYQQCNLPTGYNNSASRADFKPSSLNGQTAGPPLFSGCQRELESSGASGGPNNCKISNNYNSAGDGSLNETLFYKDTDHLRSADSSLEGTQQATDHGDAESTDAFSIMINVEECNSNNNDSLDYSKLNVDNQQHRYGNSEAKTQNGNYSAVSPPLLPFRGAGINLELPVRVRPEQQSMRTNDEGSHRSCPNGNRSPFGSNNNNNDVAATSCRSEEQHKSDSNKEGNEEYEASGVKCF